MPLLRNRAPAPVGPPPSELSDEEIEARLAWIFGSPRTGSTWLLRMLIHPWKLSGDVSNMALPRRAKRPSGRGVVPVNESHLPMHIAPFQSPRPIRKLETQPAPAELIRNTARRDDPSYFLSDHYQDVWRPRMRDLVLARFRAHLDAAARKHALSDPVAAIKEPNGSHGAEMTMSLLPRSRLVFLFRDGRDVLDSQLRLRSSDQRPGRRMAVILHEEQRSNFVKGHIRLWVNNMNAVQSAYEAHPEELRYRLRYETLRERPVETLRELTDFLELGRTDKDVERAVDAEAFEKAPRVRRGPDHRKATPGLWRKNLTPEDLEVFDELAGEKLSELGYER